jgi:hypothetical protein
MTYESQCADGEMYVTWSCPNCEVLGRPMLWFDWTEASGGADGGASDNSTNNAEVDYLFSAKSFTYWFEGGPIIPLESNKLNGTVTLPVSGNNFRGKDATAVEISLIPSVYMNLVNREEGDGFRVQYKATQLGSQSSPDTYTFDENELHFQIQLSTGITMLDIQILQKTSLFKAWADAGGERFPIYISSCPCFPTAPRLVFPAPCRFSNVLVPILYPYLPSASQDFSGPLQVW